MKHNNYVCAVGDSFVFGSELVTTHYPELINSVDRNKYSELEFGVCADNTMREQYDSKLNSMRFSSAVANELGYGHFNYAQGGASQEGIKLQTYLLLDYLHDIGINPNNTVWLVGLTMPHRKLMLTNPHDWTIVNQIKLCNNEYWVWSRKSLETFFGDRITQSFAYTEGFTKEVIAATSETQVGVSWLMNVLDTFNILVSHGVAPKNILILNLFYSMNLTTYEQLDGAPKTTKRMLELLARPILDHIHPAPDKHFEEYFEGNVNYGHCDHRHPNKDGHKLIADYLVKKILAAQH